MFDIIFVIVLIISTIFYGYATQTPAGFYDDPSAVTDTLYASEPSATVLYPGGKSTDAANGFSRVEARFEYNPEDGLYYRYQYGDKHIDELTGEQLAFTNVIFQYCHGEVRDAEDYLAFGCHGDNGYKVHFGSRPSKEIIGSISNKL